MKLTLEQRFDKFFEIVVGLEGGYVNDPKDPGGETKYGVSKRAYPNLDIKNLTLEGAKAIYKRDYFDKVPHLQDIDLHLTVFDTAINSGVSVAASILRTNKTADAYNVARMRFYTSIRNFDRFGKGWINRLAHIIESGNKLKELDAKRAEYEVFVLEDENGTQIRRGKFLASIDAEPLQIEGRRLDVRAVV